MFPNFIIIIDVTARGTNKALSFWAVTIFDPVWVIKNHILDCFLVNSVLAWPQIASGRSQSSRKPPIFPAQSFQISFRDTKGTSLLFPRVFKQLSTRADSEESQAPREMDTVIWEANQIICHLGPRTEEKRLRNACLFAKVGV